MSHSDHLRADMNSNSSMSPRNCWLTVAEGENFKEGTIMRVLRMKNRYSKAREIRFI